ncbi:hypothetical protein MAPG_08291 [Magnaporthiopsis poae ATCC 64411]|uniref:Uncharacterized protein n=1 Tax=Magnaporthiopsis poae (strain ATCC 64411 / 73-15) TaxID=644358 RepID=A0A0C4E6Z1_MAGP6|nr:hypothetical protein MAPG_08291 [Magnaporthiopsis poae ATCC 64411]
MDLLLADRLSNLCCNWPWSSDSALLGRSVQGRLYRGGAWPSTVYRGLPRPDPCRLGDARVIGTSGDTLGTFGRGLRARTAIGKTFRKSQFSRSRRPPQA